MKKTNSFYLCRLLNTEDVHYSYSCVFFLHIFHLVMPNRRWGKKKHTTSASSWEDNGLEKALLLLQLKCENTSPIHQSPPPFLSTPERRDGSFAIFPGYEIKYGTTTRYVIWAASKKTQNSWRDVHKEVEKRNHSSELWRTVGGATRCTNTHVWSTHA